MNTYEISEKVLELFNFEVKDVNDEKGRLTLMNLFYKVFLEEFGVDLDNVVKVQLCQVTSGENDMIPYVNFISCAETVLPDVKVGLLEAIAPTTDFVWRFLKRAVECFESCDAIMSHLYELADPYIQSMKRSRELEQKIAAINAASAELEVKINNEELKYEEATKNLAAAKEKRKTLLAGPSKEIQQKAILLKKQSLQLKIQERAAQIKSKEEKINSYMNRPLRSNIEISRLQAELSHTRINSPGKKLERKNELTELNKVLADRFALVENISQSILKFKELKKQLTDDKKELDSKTELNDIKSNILGLKSELDNLNKLDTTEEPLNMVKTECGIVAAKIQKLKATEKNVVEMELKLNQITEKAASMKSSFEEKDEKLEKSRENTAKQTEERIKLLQEMRILQNKLKKG